MQNGPLEMLTAKLYSIPVKLQFSNGLNQSNLVDFLGGGEAHIPDINIQFLQH